MPWPCDQQLVRFSDAVMVKNPPRSGSSRQRPAIASRNAARTAGALVQTAWNAPSWTPRQSGCRWNTGAAAGSERGSFR
jgi:hypothetical protein